MTAVKATIKGLDRLKPRARQATARVQHAVRDVLADGAASIAANARRRVLVLRDAGRPGPSELAESIRTEETEAEVRVVADAPHAAHVEFGTRRAAAQPFLAPAAEEERRGIIERAGDVLRRGGGA